MDQTGTKADAEVISFPEPEDENEDLPGDSEVGRYCDRTSDPCVVRRYAQTREQGKSPFSQFSRVISRLSTLPSIAVNCPGPRSPRGPAPARQSRRDIDSSQRLLHPVAHPVSTETPLTV